MTHLEPLKRIWEDQVVFEKLLHSKVDPNARCSFSIAGMALMLAVVEAMGTFRNPSIARSGDRDKNWKAFEEFLSNHLTNWKVVEPQSGTVVPQLLWKSFRNGITHDLRVGQFDRVNQLWGSLEFRENFSNSQNTRFELKGNLLRICPVAFFNDLKCGVEDYFRQLLPGGTLLAKFGDRFDEVYPN